VSASDGPAGPAPTPALTLAEEQRLTTVNRIVRAAGRLVSDQGLDVTVEGIAEASGVSRRTVFRHFPTRENLLAAAVEGWVQDFGEALPRYRCGEGRAWVSELLATIHRINATCGPGFWEFVTRRDLGPELAAAQQRRETARDVGMGRLAQGAWAALGRRGRVDAEAAAVFVAHCSPHFTAAVVDEGGGDAALAARLAESAILAAMAGPRA
jgi:AcrR family transcriptional regulator